MRANSPAALPAGRAEPSNPDPAEAGPAEAVEPGDDGDDGVEDEGMAPDCRERSAAAGRAGDETRPAFVKRRQGAAEGMDAEDPGRVRLAHDRDDVDEARGQGAPAPAAPPTQPADPPRGRQAMPRKSRQ